MGCGSSSTSGTDTTTPSKQDTKKDSAKGQSNGSATVKHTRNDSAKQNARGASVAPRCTSASSTASTRKPVVERQSSYDTESQRSGGKSVKHDDSVSRSGTNDKHGDKKEGHQHADVDELANQVQANLLATDDSVGGRTRKENEIREQQGPNVQQTRDKKHEERAKRLEERRSKVNLDEDEAQAIQELGLEAIVVPEQHSNTDDSDYTVDDVLNHNQEVGTRDWFKYGRRVYSAELMLPLVKERMEDYKEVALYGQYNSFLLAGCSQHYDPNPNPNESEADVMSLRRGYPIRTARYYGVTRVELNKILTLCLIGKVVEINRDCMLSMFKQGVENTLEELSDMDSEDANDFRDQLNRWLHGYPTVQLNNELPQSGVDPNEQTFPLPKPILFDPLILRQWVEDWEVLDTEIGEEGAWSQLGLLNEDFGDAHETFAALVKSHVDEGLPDLDMSIDGEAGWNVIEIDLVKNDTTTDGQEKTWTCRAKRKKINDPEWMTKRRDEIAASFIARHEMGPNVMSPYLSFCQNMEDAWKQFQKLVEENFMPPKHAAIDTSNIQERPLKRRQTSAGSIASSIVSGVLSVHGDDAPQMHSTDNSDHNAMHYAENGQDNQLFNSEIDDDTISKDNDEPANAFLTLADDDDDVDDDEANDQDDPHRQGSGADSAVESDNDQLQLDSERSGDQVDDNRHAVDMEASGILIYDDVSGVDEKSNAPGTPTKVPYHGQPAAESDDSKSESSNDDIKLVNKSPLPEFP